MKYEDLHVFVVWQTDKTDKYGEIIYENSKKNFKGNKWEARKYADKHNMDIRFTTMTEVII